ncbi:hypothetical protein HDE_07331 [Halotydeus destructor]|nr:hypothetical protein HDE_07331 [Halotydeus destructor]
MWCFILMCMVVVCNVAECSIHISEFVRHGELEYMEIYVKAKMTKDQCVQACRDFGAQLCEPRTDEQESFIKKTFCSSWINVFYGTTASSQWRTWRYGSDGRPVKQTKWSPDKAERAQLDTVVTIWPNGWDGWEPSTRIERCVCQRPFRTQIAQVNPL